jgi:hypothetical protein
MQSSDSFAQSQGALRKLSDTFLPFFQKSQVLNWQCSRQVGLQNQVGRELIAAPHDVTWQPAELRPTLQNWIVCV